jgi:hypothetical protein
MLGNDVTVPIRIDVSEIYKFVELVFFFFFFFKKKVLVYTMRLFFIL